MSKTYPEYKASGNEWLSEVPAHWATVKLRHVAEFTGGGTPSKSNDEYWQGDIPWVSPKDMKTDWVSDTEDHVTEEAIGESSTKLVEEGAVLLVVRSGILRHSLPVAINTCPVTLNQDMKAIVPDKRLIPDYLRFYIIGNENNLLQEWRKQGATVESIEQQFLSQHRMLLPPLAEQRTIAAYLDRKTAQIDTLIAKKQRLIDLLQEQRTAVINRAVTQGLDADAPMQDSGIEWLGEVPAHWEKLPTKRILASSEYGVSESLSGEGPIRVLTMAHIQNGEIEVPDEGSLQEVPEDLLLRKNDLLFNRTNSLDHVGKVGIFRGCEEDQVSFASYLVRLRPNEKAVPHYLHYLLNSSLVLAIARSIAIPSINQANLNPTRYGRIEVCLPPIEEQKQIVNHLDSKCAEIGSLIDREKNLIDKLQELRNSLISEVVTGKIDVRDDVPQPAEVAA